MGERGGVVSNLLITGILRGTSDGYKGKTQTQLPKESNRRVDSRGLYQQGVDERLPHRQRITIGSESYSCMFQR